MAWRLNGLNLYRALLLAYPAEFRQEFGAEMTRVIAGRRESEPPVVLWFSLLADTAVNAPREHIHILVRDLRHSLRLLAKAPGFTAVALLALALGLGAAITIFSLVNAVLIRSLPYGHAERLVYLWTPLPRYAPLPRELSPDFADVLAWRKMSRSFDSITALQEKMMTLRTGGEPVRIGAALVLSNFFQTLEAPPLLGRTFDPADDHPGHNDVAVISYGLWSSRFGQDPAVLGKIIQVGARPRRIVGVMPPRFEYPHDNDVPYGLPTLQRTDVWIPAGLTPEEENDRMLSTHAAIGRLRTGVNLRQAQAEMSVIQRSLDALNVPEMRGTQSLLVPFIDTTVGPVRPLMRLLAWAVVLVLLIACGNVASLLMARAMGRVHEMGVRTAMGAPRTRLVRQLLTESLLLSVTGGTLGVLLGFGALRILPAWNPGDIPRLEEASLDPRVLLFGVLASLLTGIVFGILPAFTSSRVNVSEMLRLGGGRGVAGSSSRLHHTLVIADVALAVVLLSGAGLLIRTYFYIQGEDKGFAPSTLTMRLEPQSRPRAEMEAFLHNVLDRIAALPGVAAVGAASTVPLSHSESMTTFRVEGFPNDRDQTVDSRSTAGDYFGAMQMRLITGRFLTAADTPAEPTTVPPSVVVSDSFARTYFPGRSALGGRIQWGELGDTWSTVVGVVADVRHSSLEAPPRPTIYRASWSSETLAIRTSLPPEAMIRAVRTAVRQLDPAAALTDIRTMQQRTSEASARRRFQTALLAAFAGIAVFLALVGLYGLLSCTVRQRVPEIGVRVALGASRSAVIGMVVRRGILLTAAGLAIGLAAAVVVTRWAATFLYGIRPLDPVTFAAVPAFTLLAAGVACFAPAWRAARTDPVSALRQS